MGKPRILLVDDEVAIRNLYQIYFESTGYAVTAASSVGEALRYLRKDQFAIALIDICLGQDSGIDLLKGIIQADVGLPAIIITGVPSDQPLFLEALESGAAAVFPKSRPLAELSAQIQRVLSACKKVAG